MNGWTQQDPTTQEKARDEWMSENDGGKMVE